MRHILDKYHAAAKQQGVRIVHCCGFDSIPSDLGTCLVVDHLNRLGKYAPSTCHIAQYLSACTNYMQFLCLPAAVEFDLQYIVHFCLLVCIQALHIEYNICAVQHSCVVQYQHTACRWEVTNSNERIIGEVFHHESTGGSVANTSPVAQHGNQ